MTQAASNTGAAAVILAGGRSTRLGRDKASEILMGRSLLQRAVDPFAGLVSQYVIVRHRDQALPAIEADADVIVAEDLYPDAGPLGGIFTGLSAAARENTVVVACDMPLLQSTLLAELIRLAPDHELVVPLHNGLPEPLCAAYSKACIEPIRKNLDAGLLKVSGFFDAVKPRYMPEDEWRRFDPGALSFQNLNRESDLKRIQALIGRPLT